jgi:Flp pilus assembly pilin Flp
MLMRIRRWMGRARGATAAEYLIMIILAVLLFMVALRLFGSTLQDKFRGASGEIATLGPIDGTSKGASGSAARSGRDSASGSSARHYDEPARGKQQTHYDADDKVEAPPPRGVSVGGFNVIILLIFGALVGLLIYVMFAKKQG